MFLPYDTSSITHPAAMTPHDASRATAANPYVPPAIVPSACGMFLSKPIRADQPPSGSPPASCEGVGQFSYAPISNQRALSRTACGARSDILTFGVPHDPRTKSRRADL